MQIDDGQMKRLARKGSERFTPVLRERKMVTTAQELAQKRNHVVIVVGDQDSRRRHRIGGEDPRRKARVAAASGALGRFDDREQLLELHHLSFDRRQRMCLVLVQLSLSSRGEETSV